MSDAEKAFINGMTDEQFEEYIGLRDHELNCYRISDAIHAGRITKVQFGNRIFALKEVTEEDE